MRLLLIVIMASCILPNLMAQDIFTRGLVYQEPGMKNVIVKENNSFASNDTTLVFDIYYPPSFDFKKNLPVVIYNNGGSLDLHRWGIYKDWAKLTAAHGMIAVNYQARQGKGIPDGTAMLDHISKNAASLNIDRDKIGMWTCSGNARTGMRLAYKVKPELIKTLVVYYGGPDSLGQLRQDMPTLMVRAGLDAQFLNTGIDNFIQSALQQDVQIELINYVRGIHAFDAFQPAEEANEIILKTISFLHKNLTKPRVSQDYVLTNKNFMWLIMNNQLPKALEEFRKARTMYRADPLFQPFYNAVIREDVLNANAYWLMNNRRQGDALEVFKLAVESYPESPNAYESLSEAYDVTGNKEEALRNAEISLQKLPAATNLNENFKQGIKRSAEERINRLKNPPGSTSLPPKRAHHEVVYDAFNKRILLSGGSTPLNGGSSFEFFNDLWSFDGKEWKFIGVAGDRRSGIKMAYDSKRKKIYSFGGFSGSSSLADLRVLENGEWKTVSNFPEMKAAEPGFVYDESRDRLIAFGGSADRNVQGNTWEWDGSAWKKFEGPGPGARQAFAMVYDSKNKKTILFGGMNGEGKGFEDGIWEFDGKAWRNIPFNGPNPGARGTPGYAYDSKRGLFIIFGGMSNGSFKNDTWSWNGKEWKQLADKGPAPRGMGYMAYDKHRDRIVLFGGRLGWPNDTNDTWEWDGINWMERKF